MTRLRDRAAAVRRDAETWVRLWRLFGGSHALAWPHTEPDRRPRQAHSRDARRRLDNQPLRDAAGYPCLTCSDKKASN